PVGPGPNMPLPAGRGKRAWWMYRIPNLVRLQGVKAQRKCPDPQALDLQSAGAGLPHWISSAERPGFGGTTRGLQRCTSGLGWLDATTPEVQRMCDTVRGDHSSALRDRSTAATRAHQRLTRDLRVPTRGLQGSTR